MFIIRSVHYQSLYYTFYHGHFRWCIILCSCNNINTLVDALVASETGLCQRAEALWGNVGMCLYLALLPDSGRRSHVCLGILTRDCIHLASSDCNSPAFGKGVVLLSLEVLHSMESGSYDQLLLLAPMPWKDVCMCTSTVLLSHSQHQAKKPKDST